MVVSVQQDLFGAATTLEPLKPEKVPSSNAAIPAPQAADKPSRASGLPSVSSSVSGEASYKGWRNSASYLAALYVSNDAKAVGLIRTAVDDAFVVDRRKVSQIFSVSRAHADDDDARIGLHGRRLVLEPWAEGDVDWAAIALSVVEDERRSSAFKIVNDGVLHAIGSAVVEANVLKLTAGQLARDRYVAVDRLLRMLGGRWDRKAGGHVFASDPTDAIEHLLLTGEVDKPEKPDNFGAFFTPPDLAQQVIADARLVAGQTLLEPSAGGAALLAPAAAIVGLENCFAVELQAHLAKALGDRGFHVACGDFLSRSQWHPRGAVDRLLINPPFGKQADVDHVHHAFGMLAPGGRLVGIMAAGINFRTSAKTLRLRELIAACGSIQPNPPGSFKSAGTNVSTVRVVLDKAS